MAGHSMINNTIWFPIVGVLIGVLGFFNWTYSEEAFVPCRGNKPNDTGLRVLVESVYANNANALASQKQLGLPETPIKGKPADVDVLKWCTCVYAKNTEKYGEEIAQSMASFGPSQKAKYNQWLLKLPPKEAIEHAVTLWSIETTCVNSSL